AIAHRRLDLVTAVKAGATLTLLATDRTLDAGADAYAAVLVGLGGAYVLASLLPLLPWQRVTGRIAGIAHIAAVALISTTPPELQGGLLLAGAACILAAAIVARTPELGGVAAALVVLAWRTLVTVPAQLDTTLAGTARGDVPLPALLLTVGIAVRLLM